ncbi:MAG TPA: ATP-binding protein [Gemmatimonadales bacterium]|nr:ATP-binding protein [Gemmatimonadales bacterium]
MSPQHRSPGGDSEESLRSQVAFLRAVIDLNPSFVFVKDWDGRFILANKAVADHYGTTVEELEGKTDADFNSNAEEVAHFRRADQEVIRAGLTKLIPEEPVTNRRTGAQQWFQTVKIPVSLPGYDRPLVLGISTDISALHNLEQQVRLAQKLEAVGTLASGIAHDFNNLLAALKATAELVLHDLPDGASAETDLRAMLDLIERATSLTRQLLAFGRKQVLGARVVDMAALVNETTAMLRRVIGEDIRLAVSQSGAALTVSADPGQIEQVLMNLCLNARDAMPDGGDLTIMCDRFVVDDRFCEAHPWARPGDYVRLTVSDTGSGMDEETKARIFEPFFTTKQLGRGTGLGLAVVYGIVKQHGGLIHVYSEPGHGTTFKVYFPYVAASPERRAAPAEPELKGGSERLLVAEDDESLRAVATRLLRRLGYDVVAVGNGSQALRVLEEEGDRIDLAILDVIMPELPGVSVFEVARRCHPGLRFLFTSGYPPGTGRFRSLEGAKVNFLSKPYGIRELATAVRQALDAH